jgi:tetratricopeptide (TPR) repeat protein
MKIYTEAYHLAEKISVHPKASVRQIAEAKSMRGDVYWADASWQGKKHKDARTLYQGVFDLHASEALDRAAQAKLAALTLDSTNVQDKIKRVLIGQVSSQLKMTLLHEIIDELPSWGLAYYLVGRQHHFDQEYAASNRYLSKAANFGLPHPILQIENTRLIGVNAYHLGRYDQSIQQFQEIATDSAEDWIERCKWAKRKKGN